MSPSQVDERRPRFSIIMAAYNSEKTILGAIGSVLRQEEGDLELVVVDDGSMDDTARLVKSVADHRLRCVNTQNRGVSAARNLGIAQSRGDVITFLDSDDEADPEWLSTLRVLLAGNHVGIAFCGMLAIPPDRPPHLVPPRNRGPMFGSAVCSFLPGAYAVRRRLMEEVGGFDDRLGFSENWELGVRLMDTCSRLGLETAATDAPLIRWARPTLARHTSPARLEHQLVAGRVVLQKHSDAFRRDPSMAAKFLAVAGVAAARLGRLGEARHLFAQAIRRRPLKPHNYGRFIAALDPRLAAMVWGTAVSGSGPRDGSVMSGS